MANNIFNYSINDGFLWSEVNLKGEKKFYIEGYASTIDEDKAGEILDLSAQQDICNQMQGTNITMDIEHEEWYDASGNILQRPKNEKIPVAKIVSAELRPRGTWVKAEINTNVNSFKQVWGSIKDGFLKAFSVAFYPVQKSGNVIKHLNLVNVTLTGSPVNPNATFAVSMKSAAAWLDSQEAITKADYKPTLTNPADSQTTTLDNPADNPESPETPKTKSEENMAECDKCDKEFADKEKLAEHKEEAHGTEEKTEKPEVKAEEPVIDVQAEVKAMKDAHEAEMAALKAENASLKAELEKPVMKATVEATMPEVKPVMQIVSPLNLVR
jgi:uncharacterized C2H2 Zn-finger protein